MPQPLFVAERVRTLDASRAAILFIDETQVKLNAGAVLTVREVAQHRRRPDGARAESSGEGWFRTKNPRSGLTIQDAGGGRRRARHRDQPAHRPPTTKPC